MSQAGIIILWWRGCVLLTDPAFLNIGYIGQLQGGSLRGKKICLLDIVKDDGW